MKVGFSDSFFESLKKIKLNNRWYFKLIDFFRYNAPKFCYNLWFFRKELWAFRKWDSAYNIAIFRRSLEATVKCIEKGYEVEESRLKKVEQMKKLIQLMKNYEVDNYIEIAEKELEKVVKSDFFFEKIENNLYELKNNRTEEEKKQNKEIFDKVREIEEREWKQIWKILEGQDVSTFTDFDKEFDGTGLRGWWD